MSSSNAALAECGGTGSRLAPLGSTKGVHNQRSLILDVQHIEPGCVVETLYFLAAVAARAAQPAIERLTYIRLSTGY